MEDAQQAPHHRHHHRKEKTYLPRDKDLVIGAAHHPGTKFSLNVVEIIFDDADGLSFNDKISEAIWYELCKHDIKVLVPTGDLTKEARKATKKEREEYFRDCYEKVTENRASVKPPHLVDVWVSNEDHPGTKASLAIIKDSLQEGVAFSTTVYEHIMAQLQHRRFLVESGCQHFPWRAATEEERKTFIREAFLEAKSELDKASNTSHSSDQEDSR